MPESVACFLVPVRQVRKGSGAMRRVVAIPVGMVVARAAFADAAESIGEESASEVVDEMHSHVHAAAVDDDPLALAETVAHRLRRQAGDPANFAVLDVVQADLALH